MTTRGNENEGEKLNRQSSIKTYSKWPSNTAKHGPKFWKWLGQSRTRNQRTFSMGQMLAGGETIYESKQEANGF